MNDADNTESRATKRAIWCRQRLSGVLGAELARELLRRGWASFLDSYLWKRIYLVFHPLSRAEIETARAIVKDIEPSLDGDEILTRYWYARWKRTNVVRRKRREWRSQAAGNEVTR